jgi:pimeloyl-ACP methyl ester carboxylesterase
MRVVCVLSVVALTTGCSLLRSSREPLNTAALINDRRACVLVLLPGIGDDPALFREHGFHDAAEKSPEPCDVVSVDSHFGYYRDAVLVERLTAEVLSPLRARYERTWLVGVSLGGYGAALVAEARPELIDGVVMISPFLGVPSQVTPLLRRIDAAGGLDDYDGPFAQRSKPKRHFMEPDPLWAWLASRARGDEGPRLVFAWGRADRFDPQQSVVGAALEPGDVVQHHGDHSWETFGALWRQVAASAPWSRG